MLQKFLQATKENNLNLLNRIIDEVSNFDNISSSWETDPLIAVITSHFEPHIKIDIIRSLLSKGVCLKAAKEDKEFVSFVNYFLEQNNQGLAQALVPNRDLGFLNEANQLRLYFFAVKNHIPAAFLFSNNINELAKKVVYNSIMSKSTTIINCPWIEPNDIFRLIDKNKLEEFANTSNNPELSGAIRLFIETNAAEAKAVINEIMTGSLSEEATDKIHNRKIWLNFIDEFDNFPLKAACNSRFNDIIRYLIELGADVNAQGMYTTLMSAASEGNVQAVELLLKYGARVNDVSNEGFTALTCAALQGHLQVIKILLNNKANVNVQQHDGYTPLMAAAEDGNVEVIEMLIEKGAILDTKNEQGETALIIAASNNKKDAVEYLLNAGANVFITNNEGKSAIACLLENNLRLSTNPIDQFNQSFVSRINNASVIRHSI